jgi:hypothetical protein
MLQRICIGLTVFLFLSNPVRAATVAEQGLPAGWSTAYCSPCVFHNAPATFTASRMFASFDLDAAAVLDGATLPALSNALGYLGDVSVTIWSTPFAAEGPLLQTVIPEGQYAPFAGSRGYIDLGLPDWSLAAGTYWLSVSGINGGAFQWGGVLDSGDDKRYVNGAPYLASGATAARNYLLGFSLRGSEPVATPIGGTLPLLGGGLMLMAILRRRTQG